MDEINHPNYYHAGSIEVIDAIEAWGLNFHRGNVVKYVSRAGHKGNPLTDLKKARWYLDREIERLEKGDIAKNPAPGGAAANHCDFLASCVLPRGHTELCYIATGGVAAAGAPHD